MVVGCRGEEARDLAIPGDCIDRPCSGGESTTQIEKNVRKPTASEGAKQLDCACSLIARSHASKGAPLWPGSEASSVPFSLCQMYTLLSSLPLTTNDSPAAPPPNPERITKRPCRSVWPRKRAAGADGHARPSGPRS